MSTTYPTATTLRRVARTVRAACEKLAPTLGFGAEQLPMFCPYASTAMVGALADEGIEGLLMAGHFLGVGHIWTDVQTGPESWETTLLDVTATQFRANWPRVMVIAPWHYRRRPYCNVEAIGSAAVTSLFPKDADLLRVLPTRWWTLLDDLAATLDARVLAAIQDHPKMKPPGLARVARASITDTWGALGRLASRKPVYDLAPGQHGALLVPAGGMPMIPLAFCA